MLTEPPPLAICIAIATSYFALLGAGILVLRLRMFADALVRGPADATGVALTFEGGPDPKSTRELLDALDEHDLKATFFVVAKDAESQPDLAREIAERGHGLGVLGFANDRLLVLRGNKHVRTDLERAVRAIESITTQAPLFFRPPRGLTNPTIARIADQLDLTVVGWSATDKTLHQLEDGAIVALRDASSIPAVLEALAAKNLRVTPLSAWA